MMRSLRPAASYRELLTDPLGRYGHEQRVFGWGLDRERIGYAVWGRPGESDIDLLFSGLDGPHPPSLALPCDLVLDLRRVEGGDAATFDYLLRITTAKRDRVAARIRRQAIVRSSGLVAAAAEGFGALLGPRHAWEVFDSLAAALEWLGVEDAAAQADALDDLIATASTGSPLLSRVRAYLAAEIGRKSIQQAAHALSLSVRTLQRELREAGTSFRQESDRVLVEQAKELLARSDLKLEAIAHRLGCASLASFDAFFRRTTGQSPSAVRLALSRDLK
jgi:AraC-like DNA-binding protein